MTATPDQDAARRQAIGKISNSMMSLILLKDTTTLDDYQRDLVGSILEDLTRARFLLVEHCDPDNVLVELSQL